VSGLLKAVDRPMEFEIINIGHSRPTSRRDIIDILAKHLDKPADIEYLTSGPGDMQSTMAGMEKAAKLLDYAPTVPIEVGLSRFVTWYQATPVREERIPNG
jgi:UDP-glucuronate 4-epimerase